MYVPDAFAVKDVPVLYDWIERWNFGTLITCNRGRLEANQLPFLLDREKHQLLGHLARGNKHWMALMNAEDVLVQFNGPHAYVSPSWYNQPDGVPTWNFVSVQVKGKAELIKTENESLELLRGLSRQHERAYDSPWQVDGMDATRLKELLQGIVCFRIQISDLQGKAKLSQNRSKMDRIGVIRELSASEETSSQALAQLMMQDLKQRKDP